MPAVQRHTGRVTAEGTLVMRNLSRWHESLVRLAGHDVEVVVRRPRQPTTKSQHGYYRSTLLPLAAEEWGWADPDELHRALKMKHLPYGIIPIEDGRWRVRKFGTNTEVEPPSMADFSIEETRQFLDRVIHQMQEAGITVPPPREAA